jgi:transcription-repair coupling factor (superfamily II helicase)
VGRGAQRAHAYFFRHNKIAPTPEGRQRLETIAENTQLGAGFSIAMRDLEIRGTGDILGARQSGHIAAVGFHLYTRLLAEAVRRLRLDAGRPVAQPAGGLPISLTAQLPNVTVELPLQAALPSAYVADKTVRLGLYRRMADLRSPAELDALTEEFIDRFGPPPEPVQNLLYQLKARLLADRAGLATIATESGQIVLRFPDAELPKGLPELGPRVRVGKTGLWIASANQSDWPVVLLDTLTALSERRLVPSA